MARGRRRGGRRGRGRGSRILKVREVAYQIPNQEPCNFIEFSMYCISGTPISWTFGGSGTPGLFDYIFGNTHNGGTIPGYINYASCRKIRISSLVVEPMTNAYSATTPYITQGEFTMGLSGNSYWSNDENKPIRVRFREEYGKDGMWHLCDPAAATPAFFAIDPAYVNRTVISIQANNQPVSTAPSIQTEIRFRIAWSDVGD